MFIICEGLAFIKPPTEKAKLAVNFTFINPKSYVALYSLQGICILFQP